MKRNEKKWGRQGLDLREGHDLTMKPSAPIFTHKGWFWLCPIFLAPNEPDCPVEARAAWLEPLFTVCEWFEQARIFVTSMLVPGYEPTFMFAVTDKV